MEQELDGKLSFLDTLITRNNGSLFINVYRKPTHTDRYLDYKSHHDKQHKVCTAQTLRNRAETLPNTTERKQQERKHITDALISNGYLRKFLQEVEKKLALKEAIALSREDLVKDFFDLVEPPTNYSYAILPYIEGLTEPLRRLLKPHGINQSINHSLFKHGKIFSITNVLKKIFLYYLYYLYYLNHAYLQLEN